MRILVLDTIYDAFAGGVYRRTPGLRAATYPEQRATLWQELFGTSDAYVRHLRELGHETDGAIVNWPPLQAAWLAERHVPRSLTRALTSLPTRPGQRIHAAVRQLTALAQVASFAPDVLFVHDLWSLGSRELDWLRRRVPYIVGQIASPAPPLDTLRRYDLVLSSFPHFVQRFRAAGIDSEPFRLGFYDHVNERLRETGVDPAPNAPARDGVVFIGGVAPSAHASPALEALCRALPVEVYGYGVDELPPDSAIRRRFRGPAWGIDMYRRLATARVAVNRHAVFAEGWANNMRLYEATGVGTALVTESAPNLEELFEPGVELATYRDPDELVAVVRNLLDDPAAAVRLAAAGQARTLAEHTYAERMAELSELLAERFASGRARPVSSR